MTEMPDHESLLAARFAALATPDAGDWLDVRRRARRGRVRKAALVLAAAIAAMLVAAPALGLRPHVIVEWLGAEPAPQDVQVEFEQLVGGPGGPLEFDPRVIPNAARKVTTVEHEGKEHVLWVAPTARGGFCLLWIHGSGGCIADRELPRVPTRPGELNPLLLGANWQGNGSVVTQVDGALLATRDRSPHAGIRGWERVRHPRRVGLSADRRRLLPLLDSTRAPRAGARGGRPRREGSRRHSAGARPESHGDE